jgi:hypothetical protein
MGMPMIGNTMLQQKTTVNMMPMRTRTFFQ